MARIGLFYGSTDGNTARIASHIQAYVAALLPSPAATTVECFDVADFYLEEALAFDCLILGVPTWHHGQLQRDWEAILDEFDALELTGKRVALFGLGDQVGYPDTFADALFFVADKVISRGATLVGRWPADGYTFRSSWACTDGLFLGLVLDEHNQPELTEARLAVWVGQVVGEFGVTGDG